MNSDSWNVGAFTNVFCNESSILFRTSGLCTGLLSFIAIECCSASLLLASGLFIRQWSLPDGAGQCFRLSFMDCFFDFVLIPSFIQRLRMVSLENPFSRSINLRLFP